MALFQTVLRIARSAATAALAAVVWIGTASGVALAVDRSAEELAQAARTECEQGRRAPDRTDRKAHFERGKALAGQAVAQDDSSAEAHFALFCNDPEIMHFSYQRYLLNKIRAVYPLEGTPIRIQLKSSHKRD